MAKPNDSVTLKRTYCKVYKTVDTFHDTKAKKDVVYDVYYVLFDGDIVKLNNQHLRDSVLFPFFARLVDYYEETDLVSGQIVKYFKLYSEKVPKLDLDGKPVLDRSGNPAKNTLFYVLLNGKKGYIPTTVLKYKAPADSKTRDRDLELPFRVADKFVEEYTAAAADSMEALPAVSEELPY